MHGYFNLRFLTAVADDTNAGFDCGPGPHSVVVVDVDDAGPVPSFVEPNLPPR